MTDVERDLMNALLRSVVVEERFASEIAECAYQLDQDGAHGVAAAMRNISRNHRVKSMESTAKLAALAQADASSNN